MVLPSLQEKPLFSFTSANKLESDRTIHITLQVMDNNFVFTPLGGGGNSILEEMTPEPKGMNI